MTKRTLTGDAPRKNRGKKTRGKKTGKRANRAGSQKPTRPHVSTVVPMQPTPEDAARSDAEAFEARKRQQIVRSALEMDPVDLRILEHKLRHPTITQAEIGDLIGGLSREAINLRMNAPKFKRAIAVANEGALTIYANNQAAAARKLGQLIHSGDDRVAIRACIAHMWPHIHKGNDAPGAQNEFVKIVTEAWQQEEAARAAAVNGAATGTTGTPPPASSVQNPIAFGVAPELA